MHHRFEAITVADPGLKELCLKEESGASRDSWWLKILTVDELSESEADSSRPPLPTLRGNYARRADAERARRWTLHGRLTGAARP